MIIKFRAWDKATKTMRNVMQNDVGLDLDLKWHLISDLLEVEE